MALREGRPAALSTLMDELQFFCPYCGEVNEVQVEYPFRGEMVQDCWVCCRPIHLAVHRDDWGDPQVTAQREGG